MNEDRRAALEAIAFGEDAQVKPTDRLKALEMLDNERSEREPCPECRAREWQDELTTEQAGEVLDVLHEVGALTPYVLRILTAATDTEIGRSSVAEFLRREVLDPDTLEAEVERRAQALPRPDPPADRLAPAESDAGDTEGSYPWAALVPAYETTPWPGDEDESVRARM